MRQPREPAKDRPGDDNQRLELLGDAVLGLVMAFIAYGRLALSPIT